MSGVLEQRFLKKSACIDLDSFYFTARESESKVAIFFPLFSSGFYEI